MNYCVWILVYEFLRMNSCVVTHVNILGAVGKSWHSCALENWWVYRELVSRLLKITGHFCKRTLWKRLYPTKETYTFKEPTHWSHPIAACERVGECTRDTENSEFVSVCERLRACVRELVSVRETQRTVSLWLCVKRRQIFARKSAVCEKRVRSKGLGARVRECMWLTFWVPSEKTLSTLFLSFLLSHMQLCH